MAANPGLLATMLVAGGTSIWLVIADRQMRDVAEASLKLRRALQTDPADTMRQLCQPAGMALQVIGKVHLPPLSGARTLTCVASVFHRRRPGSPPPFWQPASCETPFGGYLEPVRFRQIRVCCQRRLGPLGEGQAPCLFEWRFFMKS